MPENQVQQPQQQRPLTVAQTIALLSAKFDEVKNQALDAIAQLEAQLLSLTQQLQKKDDSNANPR